MSNQLINDKLQKTIKENGMSTYVIRAKCFGYKDEVFYVAGNRIANVFHDKTQAE